MEPCSVADGSWTDEKHLHFLNFLESSFLHAMFGECGGGKYGLRLVGAPVDRELPDYCDPTRDSGPHLWKKKTHLHKGTGIMNKPKKSMRSTTTSKQRSDPSNDQVVPQLAERAGGDDKVEEKDHRRKTRDVGPN